MPEPGMVPGAVQGFFWKFENLSVSAKSDELRDNDLQRKYHISGLLPVKTRVFLKV